MRMISCIIFVVLTVTAVCVAQQPSFRGIHAHNETLYVTADQYHSVNIDGKVTLKVLYQDSLDAVARHLGEPAEVKDVSTILSGEIVIRYEGLEFLYTNIPGSWELTEVTLNSDGHFIRLGEHALSPGMSIGGLKKIMPDGFDLSGTDNIRIFIAVSDGNGGVRFRNGEPMFADVEFIRIHFNIGTARISKIEIINSYV